MFCSSTKKNWHQKKVPNGDVELQKLPSKTFSFDTSDEDGRHEEDDENEYQDARPYDKNENDEFSQNSKREETETEDEHSDGPSENTDAIP